MNEETTQLIDQNMKDTPAGPTPPSPPMDSFLAALLADPHKDRQHKLEAWLSYHRILKNQLAAELEVHPSMISRIIKGDRAPRERIEQLIKFGIPEQLLPSPSRPPGRPKGSTKRKPPASDQ